MRIISVGGAHSGCGKTLVAELLLRSLKGRWAALKYTKRALYTSLSEGTSDEPPHKDTARLRRAGARRVLWLQSPPDAIVEALPMALQMVSDCDGLVTEGNSLIEFLNPDIVIFVFGRDRDRIKPSAERILKRADFVLGWDADRLVDLRAPSAGVIERIRDVLQRRPDKRDEKQEW